MAVNAQNKIRTLYLSSHAIPPVLNTVLPGCFARGGEAEMGRQEIRTRLAWCRPRERSRHISLQREHPRALVGASA